MDESMRAADAAVALPSTVRHPASVKLIRAWLRWRGERLVPVRSAVKLADVADLLSSLALLEVIDAGTIRFRVAGGRLRDYAGIELTGRNLAELTSPEQWPTRRHRIEQMVHTPCGATWTQHRATAAYEMVALPVVADAPGGAPLVIAAVSPATAALEPAAALRILSVASEFRFVDIGAGIPERTEP